MYPVHHRPPPAPAETILNDVQGYFSVVVADGTTNLITNPSAETNTTGHSGAAGAAISRVSTRQRYGAYAFQCTPSGSGSSGQVYNSIPVILPSIHTASLDFWGTAGRPYRLEIIDSGAVVASLRFFATGRWQRVATTGRIAIGTSVQVRVRHDNFISAAPFWTDGWQLEAKGYATTYCDGDQRGIHPFDFYWVGTPHASQSVRAGTTRAGGKIVNLHTFGFRLLAYIGLSSLLLTTITTPLTTGGAIVQDQRMAESSLSLIGFMTGQDLADLQRQRGPLFAALSAAAVPQLQPLVLRYQPCDDEGNPSGDTLTIPCYWQPSPGEITSTHHSRVALDFSVYLPLIAKGHGAAIVPARQTITPFDHIMMRSPTGAWSTSFTGTTGANNVIRALTVGADGTLYAGGNFTSIGGNAVTRLAYWNGSAWSGLGIGGPNGLVRAIAVAPNGDVYIGGDFTSVAGTPANRIAKWSASTLSWSALGTGMNGAVNALALGIDGTLFAGGAFTTAGGGVATYIARWTGSAWSALYGGMNGDVYTLKIGPEGLYVGGAFTLADVIPASRIALWDGATWFALGDGLAETVYAIEERNGTVYAGGLFEATGAGAPALHVAQWTGNQWSAMGAGITTDGLVGSGVFSLVAQADGTLVATGHGLTESGDTPLIENLALWNGSVWTPLDVDIASPFSGIEIYVSTQLQDGTLVLAPVSSGITAAVPVPTTVTIGGTLPTWPVVTFAAPSNATATVYQLINETTGAAIYLNLTLLAGEVATLDLTPGQISLSTNLRPNRMDTVLDGSDLANWRLLPGANIINTFGSTTSLTVTVEWDERVQSLDDATWSPAR